MSMKLVLTNKTDINKIQHHKRTHKGDRVSHETEVKISEWHNTGKRYPYSSKKRGGKKDFIITI